MSSKTAASAANIAPPGSWRRDWQTNKVVYILVIPVLIYLLVMNYLPMFGITMAFQDFNIADGFFGSEWIGFQNFIDLFTGDLFLTALRNTLILAGYNLTFSFVAPIIFAFLITSVRNKKIRRICQTMSYMPNFVASVVVVSLLRMFLAYDGPLTQILTALGFEQQNWLANDEPPVFWVIYTAMSIWGGFGFGSIMYVAAIENLSKEVEEAAALDGANRLQLIFKVILPNIMPLIIMMWVLQIGLALRTGSDRILLMYMPSTYSVADVLYTYTYRMAFEGIPDYGLSAASSLFQSIVGTAMLLTSNKLSRKMSGSSLF